MDFLNSFVQWSHSHLLNSELGTKYLISRGSSESQWIKHNLGYIPDFFHPDPTLDPGHSGKCAIHEHKQQWCDTCRFIQWSTGWSEEEKRHIVGQRILNSIVYPLTSYSGAVVGFQTRSITNKVFDNFVRSQRAEAYFFGTAGHIDKIWSRKSVALVEGPSDMLTLERFLDIGVLSLATNSTNENQTRFLSRFCDTVYLYLDLDKAGRDGSISIRRKLPDLDVRVVDYKMTGIKAKDINDMWKECGDVKLNRHLKLTFQ